MHLYNLTLQKPSAITNSVLGNFTGSKQQEICVVRGTCIIEIMHVDADSGTMSPLCSHNVFAIIRSISTAKLIGSSKDFLVVASDSGYLSILEYDGPSNSLKTVHNEPFGRSACQRRVAGQYLSVDPKGRAIMIAAIDNQKFVYILNRDSENRLTISSPLEAHSSGTVHFALTALDVDFENPVFACIEAQYSGDGENAKKQLTYYEVDMGLNLVVRKESEAVDNSAHMLIPVPGGAIGPGGLLICAEGQITWKSESRSETIQLPERNDGSSSSIIVAHHVHCMKNFFFVFLQTECGDIFKMTFSQNKDIIHAIQLQYYDTITPSVTIHVLRSGLLFAASENGDNRLFQIQSLGEDSDIIDISCTDATFEPRSILSNMSPSDYLQSSSPCMQSKVLNLFNEEIPQIYSLTGTGPNSAFKISRRGFKTDELVSYPLPGTPNGIWSLKARAGDAFDSYIILSFLNATLVLSVGETVEEVSDSGFKDDVMTLNCHQIGSSALLQIHPKGLVHIRDDGRLYEWSAGSKTITSSSCTSRQIIIVLDAIEIVCFELNEMEDIIELDKREVCQCTITSIDISPLPEGKLRSKFFAVGFSDATVRVMSLSSEIVFSSSGMQVLASVATSLVFTSDDVDHNRKSWSLNIGLENGVFMKVAVDVITGNLANARSKYIGKKSIRLFRLQVHDIVAVLILSSKPWLSYTKRGDFQIQPLSCKQLDLASGFTSEFCAHGILGSSGDTFQILTVDDLKNTMYTTSINLELTPRQFLYVEQSEIFIISEGDHRSAPEKRTVELQNDSVFIAKKKAPLGTWTSLIRVLESASGESKQVIHMEENAMITSITSCKFHGDTQFTYIAIAVAHHMDVASRQTEKAYISLYRIIDNRRLEFVHKTEVTSVVGAMCQFNGRLLIGMQKTLRIYDMGKLRLLRKSENNSLPRSVSGLRTQGDRIFISDSQESLMMARYLYQENAIVLFADDFLPRWTTTFEVLDYNTLCGADKFGNVFVKRLSKADIESIDEDPTGIKLMQDRRYLQGAGRKLETIAEFFVGDIVTSIEKTSLAFGSTEVLFYSTLSGCLGMLVPLTTNEDVEFFRTIESQIRQEFTSLCKRDHLAYRSYYFPAKCVIDGDLVERFASLPEKSKESIAEKLHRTVADIIRQVESVKEKAI